jgi:hypothetical protein
MRDCRQPLRAPLLHDRLVGYQRVDLLGVPAGQGKAPGASVASLIFAGKLPS